MRIIVLGAGGMLGNAMLRVLAADTTLDVRGTVRTDAKHSGLPDGMVSRVIPGVVLDEASAIERVFAMEKPDVVINCIGLVKQREASSIATRAIAINSLLPHRLADACGGFGARLVHISTDCVFSGEKGNYREDDVPDATDLYGRSKLLGEVVDAPHAITLRTSIIGHELRGNRSLVNWFLSQQGQAKGFTHAVFSGLPTVELARVVQECVLTRPELQGLYHVAAAPIDKFRLLTLVADAYGRQIDLIPDAELVIDRSLNADKFHAATGYIAPDWPELIRRMVAFH